jgi:hypothetical protein
MIFDSEQGNFSENKNHVVNFKKLPMMIGVSIYSFEAVGIGKIKSIFFFIF